MTTWSLSVQKETLFLCEKPVDSVVNDSTSPDDSTNSQNNDSSTDNEKEILAKRIDRWIDENLHLIYFSEFAEAFIKKFVQKFGEDNDYAKLIKSELGRLRPSHRPKKYTDARKVRIESEYRLLREFRKEWSRQEILEFLATKHRLFGESGRKKIEQIITDARKITPHK